jgi:hypothetical protein
MQRRRSVFGSRRGPLLALKRPAAAPGEGLLTGAVQKHSDDPHTKAVHAQSGWSVSGAHPMRLVASLERLFFDLGGPDPGFENAVI